MPSDQYPSFTLGNCIKFGMSWQNRKPKMVIGLQCWQKQGTTTN